MKFEFALSVGMVSIRIRLSTVISDVTALPQKEHRAPATTYSVASAPCPSQFLPVAQWTLCRARIASDPVSQV